MTRRPNVAFVVHRYHREIAGGAERHCRDMAQHMSAHWDVTVLTSCARDYRTWADEYEAGASEDEGVRVIRFPVSAERDYRRFDLLSEAVLNGGARGDREERWIEAQGPVLPGLVETLRSQHGHYDAFVFFTYLYWSTVRGIVEVADKAWLVPTAHDEKPIRLSVYDRVFSSPRVILYNTATEMEFCRRRFCERAEKEEIVGCGVEVPPGAGDSGQSGIQDKFGVSRGYLLYVGRVDRAKNADQLIGTYLAFVRHDPTWPDLVLVGPVSMDVPQHAKVKALGYVDEADKHALIRGASVLVQPSAFESLSLVLLESWLCGTPVLVNGACAVMRRQVVEAGGGLYYDTPGEFREGLTRMLSQPRMASEMARAGGEFARAHYSWPVIETKYQQVWDKYCKLRARQGG